MDETSKIALGIFAFFGIVGAIVYFATRQGKIAPERALSPREYTNKEVWNVEYSPDGLPTKIEISRHAVEE